MKKWLILTVVSFTFGMTCSASGAKTMHHKSEPTPMSKKPEDQTLKEKMQKTQRQYNKCMNERQFSAKSVCCEINGGTYNGTACLWRESSGNDKQKQEIKNTG